MKKHLVEEEQRKTWIVKRKAFEWVSINNKLLEIKIKFVLLIFNYYKNG